MPAKKVPGIRWSICVRQRTRQRVVRALPYDATEFPKMTTTRIRNLELAAFWVDRKHCVNCCPRLTWRAACSMLSQTTMILRCRSSSNFHHWLPAWLTRRGRKLVGCVVQAGRSGRSSSEVLTFLFMAVDACASPVLGEGPWRVSMSPVLLLRRSRQCGDRTRRALLKVAFLANWWPCSICARC
jgi:hypothetical protein